MLNPLYSLYNTQVLFIKLHQKLDTLYIIIQLIHTFLIEHSIHTSTDLCGLSPELRSSVQIKIWVVSLCLFEIMDITLMLSDKATCNSHGQDSLYFQGWEEYEKNSYDELDNPAGIIQMGLAENQVKFCYACFSFR